MRSSLVMRRAMGIVSSFVILRRTSAGSEGGWPIQASDSTMSRTTEDIPLVESACPVEDGADGGAFRVVAPGGIPPRGWRRRDVAEVVPTRDQNRENHLSRAHD